MSFVNCSAQESRPMHVRHESAHIEPVGLGAGQQSATVAQTFICGLGTARTHFVAGWPRTSGGDRMLLRLRSQGVMSSVTMTALPGSRTTGR
jgi:hypothetical protein